MTTSEVIREIRENSEVRDEVRRLILTEEMLTMPARLDQISRDVAALTETAKQHGERMDQLAEIQVQQAAMLARMDERLDQQGADIEILKTDVAVLKTDVAVLKTDVAVLKTDVAVLKTDVGVLKTDMRVVKGVSLEAYLHVQMSRRAANLFTLRRITIVRGPLLSDAVHDFEDEITDALKRNAISDDQHRRVFDTDLIIRGWTGKAASRHTWRLRLRSLLATTTSEKCPTR